MSACIKLCLVLLIAVAVWLEIPSPAFARGRRPSQAQTKRAQAYRKQLQQQYALAVKREQAEQKAFMTKFDTNRDGQINGKERGPAENFLRDRRLGKVGPITGGGSGPDTMGGGSLDPIGAFGAAGKEGSDGKKKK